MKYNSERHHRRSVRLKGYDYSSPGAYFVTICAWSRDCIFGEIINGEMKLNEYGKVIHGEWMRTGDIRSNVEPDEFIVMPNHFHGIITINAGNICRGMARHAPTDVNLQNRLQIHYQPSSVLLNPPQQNLLTYYAILPACLSGREIISIMSSGMKKNYSGSGNISALIPCNGISMKRIRKI